MLIFSGSSNKSLAQKIAGHKGYSLGQIEIHTFPDNENRVRVVSEVLDQDVLVVQSAGVLPNLYYMELFFILDSLKRSGARSITLVIPYFGYQRQDHVFRSGEGVSLEVIIKILETLGVDRFISFEFHSVKIPQFFKKEIKELSALPLFAEKIKKLSGARGPATRFPPASARSRNTDIRAVGSPSTPVTPHDFVLVSPDMGGIARIKKLSEILGGVPFLAIEKNRDLVTGKIESMEYSGEIKKTAVIVDDVISTGKTIISAAELLFQKGTEEVYVMATHGIFAGKAADHLQNSNIKKVIVTDTIDIPKKRRFEKLEIISVSELIATELAQK